MIKSVIDERVMVGSSQRSGLRNGEAMIKRKRTTPLSDERVELGHCSTELRARILSDVPYFKGLAAPALDAVNYHFRAFNYPAGGAIYHEGEPAEALFLVAPGRVKLLQYSASGEEVLLDLLGQSDLFGGLTMLGQRCYP